MEAETDKMGEDLERALEKIDAEMDSDDGMWMERVEGVKIGEARVRKGGRKEGELQKGDRKRCGCSKVHRGSHGN